MSPRLPRGVLLTCVLAASTTARAEAQATGPLNTLTLPRAPEARVEVRPVLPTWVAMPPTARILTSAGLEMRPVRNSAVTWENAKVGVLVGALTNVAGCARHVRVFLQYTDERWRPVGAPIESEARVSLVEPGALLPYRFRLKRAADFAQPPSGYILQVVEDGQPVADTLQWVTTAPRAEPSPCAAPPVTFATTVTRSRTTLSGHRVEGTLAVASGGAVRPDALVVTALLRDAAGDVLEVLTGVPTMKGAARGSLEPGQVVPFVLSTGIPLGKAVSTVTLFVDRLDDAAPVPPR